MQMGSQEREQNRSDSQMSQFWNLIRQVFMQLLQLLGLGWETRTQPHPGHLGTPRQGKEGEKEPDPNMLHAL